MARRSMYVLENSSVQHQHPASTDVHLVPGPVFRMEIASPDDLSVGQLSPSMDLCALLWHIGINHAAIHKLVLKHPARLTILYHFHLIPRETTLELPQRHRSNAFSGSLDLLMCHPFSARIRGL